MSEPGKLTLGIDCGGTHLRMGLVDVEYHVIAVKVYKTQEVLNSTDPVSDLAGCIRSYLAKNLPQGSSLEAIAAGFPSMVAADRQTVIDTTFIPALHNVNISKGLEEFKVPVYIDRDVNMLLRYDGRRLKLKPSNAWLGCYIGTGLGCALAVDGKILAGAHGVAGELGHIPARTGLHCGCGNDGCIETKTAGNTLTAILSDSYGPEEPIDQVFIRHGGEPFIQEWLDYLAQAIATSINLLDPTAIIIGGGIPQMEDFPKDELMRRILRMARKPVPAEDLRLLYPPVSVDDGIIGAAIYARDIKN